MHEAEESAPDRWQGYVVRSLEAALWAFHTSSSFREGALLAANLGDDADYHRRDFWTIGGRFLWRGRHTSSLVSEAGHACIHHRNGR
jgi:hypothetical protein